jgi:hypothetical protein
MYTNYQQSYQYFQPNMESMYHNHMYYNYTKNNENFYKTQPQNRYAGYGFSYFNPNPNSW